MYLEIDSVIHNDITLLIRDTKYHRVVGEMEIIDLPDGYTISCKANNNFNKLKDIDNKLEMLFNDLKFHIDKGELNYLKTKNIYLLADEHIGSRYGITNELQRIPRSAAFYFIRKEN